MIGDSQVALVIGWGSVKCAAAEEIISINQRLCTREVTSRPNRQAFLQMLLPRRIKVREYFNLLDDSLVNERLYQAFDRAG